MSINISEKSNFIWKIADLLRGDYKQSEYGEVILPFTVLCRLDSVLRDTKDEVLKANATLKYKNKAPFLTKITNYKFYNTSEFTFEKLKNDAGNIADNLIDYRLRLKGKNYFFSTLLRQGAFSWLSGH